MLISFRVICVPKRHGTPCTVLAAVSNCSVQTNTVPPVELETIVFRVMQPRVQRVKVIILLNETQKSHVWRLRWQRRLTFKIGLSIGTATDIHGNLKRRSRRIREFDPSGKGWKLTYCPQPTLSFSLYSQRSSLIWLM